MTFTAFAVAAVIVLSAVLGVYLLQRQIAAVAARRETPPAAFAGAVTLEEHHRAADYTIAKARLSIVQTIFEAVLSALWILGGLSLLYSLVAAVTAPGWARSVAFVLAFGVISWALALPVKIARVFRLESGFGFNRVTPRLFVKDEFEEAVLELVIATPLLYALFALLDWAPHSWHLFAFAGFIAFTVAMMVVYPTLIAPLFNRFTPLADAAQKARLEALLAKCGFEAKGLFVMDASKRSTHANAYFSGFGRAKRIVFFDTLLEKHSTEEIEAILAHELGHYKFGHVRQMIAQSAIVALSGFFALHWAFDGGAAAWLGLPGHPGVVVVAVLLAGEPVVHLLSPVLAWRSRRAEFEADAFARSICGEAPMVTALMRLARDNLSTLTPDRLYAAFYYSHPPVPERVAVLRGQGE